MGGTIASTGCTPPPVATAATPLPLVQQAVAAPVAAPPAAPALTGGGPVAAPVGLDQLVPALQQLVTTLQQLIATLQARAGAQSLGSATGGGAGAPTQIALTDQSAPTTPDAPDSRPAAPAAAPTALTGPAASLGKDEVQAIDVSNWQGDIDWKKVAGAGIKVAWMKASEGSDFEDKTYAKNRAGANANGITIGAYDFAKPSTGGGGAAAAGKAEAQHFLDTAKVTKGDLAPVLDLEDAGGLSKADLTTWVKSWGDTVKAATGVQPTVYTSPSFWKSHVDASAGADFRLWIANWGVNSPSVPDGFAGGWQGWQYTSDGSVDGIKGRVDRDKVKDPASLVIR